MSGGERESPGLQTKFIGAGLDRIRWEVGAVGKEGDVLRTPSFQLCL